GYDFGPMYASVAPDVRRADLAICEMETPLALPQGPFVGWPDFNAPPQVLTALTGVGYDSCTTASNHTLDQGYPGLKRTLDELDHADVVQPAQKINGKWVFYCMGNQISRHEDPIAEGREGVMPEVTFTEVRPHHFRTTSAVAIPTWMQDSPALRLIDIPRALASD